MGEWQTVTEKASQGLKRGGKVANGNREGASRPEARLESGKR
ncbi:hypothetical protein [Sutcliffiella horikoshii]|nr:hypothetical protein [Sutcliffiella horikoshii]